MIVNTGARTDTVQYYTDWLLRRFAEGYVLSRNPLFPNKVTRYELTPEKVDCVVFCSKNYAPILPRLHEITERFPTYFYYTITAYGKDVEPGVPSIEQSMETLLALSRQVGKGRIAWRYDPVLLTRKYTIERHMETFERMAATLAPHIDRCIFSFVVQKVGEQHAGDHPLFGLGDGRGGAGTGRHRAKVRRFFADLRHQRGLFPLRHPPLGLHDAGYSRQGQRH